MAQFVNAVHPHLTNCTSETPSPLPLKKLKQMGLLHKMAKANLAQLSHKASDKQQNKNIKFSFSMQKKEDPKKLIKITKINYTRREERRAKLSG